MDRPGDFILATQDGFAPNLVDVCSRLINKPETLAWLEEKLQTYPTLLTVEDYVSRHYGSEWGFSVATIEMASARVTRFNQVVGSTHYS